MPVQRTFVPLSTKTVKLCELCGTLNLRSQQGMLDLRAGMAASAVTRKSSRWLGSAWKLVTKECGSSMSPAAAPGLSATSAASAPLPARAG